MNKKGKGIMNIKNNKGITMVTLVITVILLIILAGATVTIGMNIAREAELENIQTYLLLIQTKCEKLANDKVIGNIDESGLYGTKQDDGWYKLSQGDLNDIGVKGAKAEDGYYVNYDSDEVEVKYEKGIERDGRILHTLSEILGNT